MTGVYAFLSQPVVERVGWTLVHFVWQGAAVALLLAVALVVLRRRSANARYLACCVALAVMAACPVITLWSTRSPAVPAGPETMVLAPVSPPVQIPMPVGVLPEVPVAEPPAAVEAPASPLPEPITEHIPQPARTPWWQRLRGLLEANLAWIVAVWAAGVIVLSVRLLWGWVRVQRMRASGTRDGCAAWQDAVGRLSERLKVSRPVQLLESSLARVPIAVGWLRPVILLPASALTGLTIEQLEAILAHELAHIRRHDYLVNLLQTVVDTLLFYHPAVHWVSHRVRVERESCCDDLAVAVCGDSLTYARALARVAELGRQNPHLAVAASEGKLLGRIRRIVGLPDRDPVVSARWLAGLLVVAALITAGLVMYACAGTRVAQPAVTEQPAEESESAWGEAVEGVQVEEPTFGPVIERVVRDAVDGPGNFLDLDTGELHTMPSGLATARNSHSAQMEWLLSVGIDAFGETDKDVLGLACFDAIVVPVGSESWQGITAGDLGEAVSGRRTERRALMGAKRVLPATYLFRTREGGMGILQIVGFTEDAPGVKIRYKMLQGAPLESGKGGRTRMVRLPAFNKDSLGLDLDSGELIRVPEVVTHEWASVSEREAAAAGADLVYDGVALILASGARAEKELDLRTYATQERLLRLEDLPSLVTTREGNQFLLTVLDSNDGHCELEYTLLPGVPETEAPSWGEAVEGVQVRLRADKKVWQAGEVPTFKADVRNLGAEALLTAGAGGPYELEFDGTWFDRPGDPFPSGLSLEPGATFTGVPISLDDRWETRDEKFFMGVPITVGPGRHIVRVAFVCRSATSAEGASIRAVSNLVEIEILPPSDAGEPPWGEAVEGVQVRLRADKEVWKAGEVPTFKADLKNLGQRDLSVALAQELCDVQFDGNWYIWVGEVDVKSSVFGPGREYNDIPISLDEHWQSMEIAGIRLPLDLEPGRRTVRVAFICQPAGSDTGKDVRAVSNPVEIKILPPDSPDDGPVVVQAAAAGLPTLYAVDRSANLLRIDPRTGVSAVVGNLGVNFASQYVGMDFDMAGVLYVSEAWEGRLYRVDTHAGKATLVRSVPSGWKFLENLAFAPVSVAGPEGATWPAGTLLASSEGELHAIDISTGTAHFIGNTGRGDDAYAFSPDGVLYGIDAAPGGDPNAKPPLYRIDTSSAKTTVIANSVEAYVSLAFGPDGFLYSTDPWRLWRIDPKTGASTLVGNTGRYIVGLAFQTAQTGLSPPESMPGPPTPAGDGSLTRYHGPFELDKDLPVNLDCPAVNGVTPVAVKNVRFSQQDDSLHCVVRIERETSADATFAVRVKVLTDEGIPVLLAEREFILKTLLAIDDIASLVREEKELDFGSIQQFAGASSFGVEIEDISKKAGDRKLMEAAGGIGITHHRGAFEMNKDIPVGLACPEVPGYAGRATKPLEVKSIRFTEAEGGLRCLVRIEGQTSANATFAVRVKVLTDEGVPALLAEREFIFKTLLAIDDIASLVRREKELDFGSMQQFAAAASFEVEIELVMGGRHYSDKEGTEGEAGYLAFQSRRTGRFPKDTDFARMPIRRSVLDVFIMDFGSLMPVLVSRDELNSASFFRGRSRWSPDRKWLAWPGEYALFVSDVKGESRPIYKQEPPQGPYPYAYNLLPPWGFAWGPDSARLAVWKSGDGETVICGLDGTVEKVIKPMAGTKLVDLDWSSDGTLGQVLDKGDGAFSIYTLNPDAKRPTREKILDFQGTAYGVRFSPKNPELVFIGKKGEVWSIYRVDVKTEVLTQLVGGLLGDTPPREYIVSWEGTYQGNRPRWSPDGQRLVYGNDWHICTVNRDGTDLKDLTPAGMMADAPCWSPDGRRIAFHACKPEYSHHTEGIYGWDIWLMDADGKNLGQLTKESAEDMYPEWAPY